ncbi:MAG: DUF2956 domain-containing protein [Gammaproteobacteria bacterium]
MTKQPHQKPSPQTIEEAMKLAKGTQRPGQTKEQTKLIAQGIQKGIDLYKKQQKEKARELNRKFKKASQRQEQEQVADQSTEGIEMNIVYKQYWLPWLLLIASWIGFGVYFLSVNGR